MRRLAYVLASLLAACGDDAGNTDVDAAPDDPDALLIDAGPEGDASVPPACATARTLTDRPDDNSYDQIRALYVLPSDIADLQRDTNGQICNSVRAFSTWFYNQAGSYLRFDTAGGQIDIGFVRLTKTDAVMRGNDPNNGSVDYGIAYVRERIERELVAMGMIKSNKLYAVYYEGSSSYACGAGAYPPAIIARVGTMYLNGLPPGQTKPCGQVLPWGQPSLIPNYIDYGMLHELVHSMGIVAGSSPNEHSFGHVFDASATKPNRDLMYSPRVGMNDPGWATSDPNGLLLDLGHDDYYMAPSSVEVELSTMSLLSPLPANAKRPIGW
jgi:hypothetical protein